MEEIYRDCASVVVLRTVRVCAPGGVCAPVYQVLLVHKPRKKDAWQLPQGGVEKGESLEEAASRELWEEAGIVTEIIARSSQIYRYDFPVSFRKFRPDNVCGQHVSYVFAKADPDVAVNVDGHEIDSHAWVFSEDLGKYIKRKEYLEIVRRLLEEGMGKMRMHTGELRIDN